MKYAYPVIFTPVPEGFQVNIPDLPGCVTYGTDLPDALEMAQDALEMWLWDAENKSEKIPSSNLSLKECPEGGHISLVYADTDRYRRENDTKAVKKTLSIPAWLNVKAEEANAPFSQILQEGLKDYLGLNNPPNPK